MPPRRYKSKAESTPEEWEAYLAYHREYSKRTDAKRRASLKWRNANIEACRERDRLRSKRYRIRQKEAR